MKTRTDLRYEVEVLSMFDLSSTQQGIKVHHDADALLIQATERLHKKGLLTQEDGGYLTSLGHSAAEHAQNLVSILS